MAAIVRVISRFGSHLALLAAALVLTLSIHAAHAGQGGNSQGGGQGGNSQGGGGGGNHGGPAPLIGGGLPAVLLIGAGAYLAYRRSRPTN